MDHAEQIMRDMDRLFNREQAIQRRMIETLMMALAKVPAAFPGNIVAMHHFVEGLKELGATPADLDKLREDVTKFVQEVYGK